MKLQVHRRRPRLRVAVGGVRGHRPWARSLSLFHREIDGASDRAHSAELIGGTPNGSRAPTSQPSTASSTMSSIPEDPPGAEFAPSTCSARSARAPASAQARQRPAVAIPNHRPPVLRSITPPRPPTRSPRSWRPSRRACQPAHRGCRDRHPRGWVRTGRRDLLRVRRGPWRLSGRQPRRSRARDHRPSRPRQAHERRVRRSRGRSPPRRRDSYGASRCPQVTTTGPRHVAHVAGLGPDTAPPRKSGLPPAPFLPPRSDADPAPGRLTVATARRHPSRRGTEGGADR